MSRHRQLAITLCMALSFLAVGKASAQGQCVPGLFERSTLFAWPCCDIPTCRDAWSETLATDRPDFTEASTTVGRGVSQLELGYTYYDDNDGANGSRSQTYPETLLRVGLLADWFELRLGWTMIDETNVPAGGPITTTVGSSDLYVGAKLALTEQCGIFPEMALIPQMTTPVGSAPFNEGQVLAGVNWIYAWELSDRLSTAGSSQVNHAADGVTGNGYTEFAQSWTVAYSIDDAWGAYAEYFVLAPLAAETVRPENYLNGGVTYLVNDNLQFDVRVGAGLNNAATDFFSGAGLVVRF
jgi:hypothetical protein